MITTTLCGVKPSAATIITIMLELLLFPLLAALILPLATGPLGCFIVWRRMSYFGDTLAHAGLLGVAFSLALEVNLSVAMAVTGVFIGLFLLWLGKNNQLSTDTLLGILSHTALALGLLAVSVFPHSTLNLNGYLLGDYLTLLLSDFLIICFISFSVMMILCLFWSRFLSITIDIELTKVENKTIWIFEYLLVVLTALTIGLAIKILGVLLITSLLIIPAAAAKNWSKSPEAMAILAALIGMISLVSGLIISYHIDLPPSPTIIVIAACIFFGGHFFNVRKA